MHNRLYWTTIRHQRHHDDDEIRRLAQPCKHRALPCTERFSAGLAPITRTLPAVDHDIALPDLPSCLTLQIRAELPGSVHWLCLSFHTNRIADGRSFFNPSRTSFHQLMGRYHSSSVGNFSLSMSYPVKCNYQRSKKLLLSCSLEKREPRKFKGGLRTQALSMAPPARGNPPLHLDLALGRHLWSNGRVCRAELQRELASSAVLHYIGRLDAERCAINLKHEFDGIARPLFFAHSLLVGQPAAGARPGPRAWGWVAPRPLRPPRPAAWPSGPGSVLGCL